ncbi:MAG: hypothetical protein JWO38_3366 [Gemmataceae bacterium]|nr:hypothetical protein [Gemmataceae bacterium]
MDTRADHDSRAAPTGDESGGDPRLLAAVKDYQSDLEQGRRPDRARFLAHHPDLAPALTPYLDGLDLLHRGAKDLTRSHPTATRLDTGLAGGDRVGEFEIVREIGRGGMGVVYEAVQPSLARRVAMKVLPPAFAADQTRLRRFAVEAQAAAAVSHPHIVPVYAVGEDRGVNYIVMQLIDGSPLDSLAAGVALRWNRSKDNETPPADFPRETDEVPPPGQLIDLARWDRPAYRRAVARLGSAVARALDHAHQAGVVHRDVKPANLLLGRDGHAWVTDFGLAQLADAGTVTRTGTTLGTLRYMSPEQAAGDRRRLDHRTDVYSLAATLYELLAGRPAFDAEDPLALVRQIAEDDPPPLRAADPAVPADLETILFRALQKDPRDRYATAAEFADDLDRFAAGVPVLARRPSVWERAKRWAGRHPAAVAAALASCLVVGAASGVSTAVVAAQQAETRKAYDAVAAEQGETRKAYDAADALAKAERDRADEAERRFRQSKELTDLVLAISEEEIGSNSPFQGPRRRLLRAALDNYRNLVADRHDDPAVRAELSRVEGLLAEQTEKREAEAAFLLGMPAVQGELELAPAQVEKINRIFATKGPKGGPPGPRPDPKGPRGGPPGPDQWAVAADPAVRAELIRTLTAPQRARLRQIFLQFLGPMAFNDPEAIEQLVLTPAQRQRIRVIQAEEFGPPFGRPHGPRPGDPKDNPDARSRVMGRILESLAPEQQKTWQGLTGKPFTQRPG